MECKASDINSAGLPKISLEMLRLIINHAFKHEHLPLLHRQQDCEEDTFLLMVRLIQGLQVISFHV